MSPCGRSVDWLRSCYETEVRFFADNPTTQKVRWFFTDRPRLGLPTTFGSRNWDADNGEWATDLGEVQGAVRRWRNGKPPGPLPAGGPCGTPAQWATGCLWADRLPPGEVDPFGFPTCCGGAPVLGAGGGLAGGWVGFSNTLPAVSLGGGVGGGSSLVTNSASLASLGGGLGGGSATVAIGVSLLSTGGGEGDGAGSTSDTITLVSSGGALADGSSAWTDTLTLVSTGGGLGGGSSALVVSSPITSLGGGRGGGGATLGGVPDRVTQLPVEVAYQSATTLLVTQLPLEVAYQSATSLQVTQAVIEVCYTH